MNIPSSPFPHYDILICGGGLVGATLALALAPLKLKVALVEAIPFGNAEQPSFDERTTAISNGTRRIFEAVGVWKLIERSATSIKRIHVSNKGRFSFARINADEQGLTQLGHVVVNRIMGEALWRRLSEEQIDVIAPARVTDLSLLNDRRCVNIIKAQPNGGESTQSISAQLIVAADGARSAVREAAGIGVGMRDYHQVAIVTNLATQRFHNHVAYERFTTEGPIALLPLNDARVGLVWVLARDAAEAMLQLTDEQFTQRLQAAFGLRLGRFTKIGKRFSYPLILTQADQHIAERLCVIGNAAQGLHPIAGQGFNLGLRDAACLAEVLADSSSESELPFDAGSSTVLQRYAEWRAEDRQRIIGFTDGLVRLFAQGGPVKLLRDLGMLAFDLSPRAKDYLSQLSLGAAGRVPRLARGGVLRNE